MGGKSGGPLASWIREFTTLVFVQTVQAFIFAIIIVIIMTAMPDKASTDSEDDYYSGVGIMCVFALTSLFKVEEMVRRIFGFGNTKADHKGALQSIAKTAFALKLGKRVLDNGKKVVGGVSKIKGARADSKKANKRLQEDMQDLGFSPGNAGAGRTSNTTIGRGQQGQAQQPNSLLSGINNQTYTGGTTNSGNPGANNGSQISNNGASATNNGNNNNNNPTNTNVNGNNAGALGNNNTNTNRNNTGAPQNNNVNMPPANLDIDSADIFNSNEIDLKTKQKLRAAQRTAEDAIKNAKKMRNEGIKDIAKGLAESAGAVVVGPMGAVLGGAEGNIDDAINGLISGAGLGDAIGEKAVDATVGVGKFAQNRAKNVQNFNTEMQEIKRAMNEEDKSFGEAIKTRVQERTGAIRNLEKNTEDLKKYLDDVKIKSNKSSNSNRAYRSSVDDT